MVNCLHSGENSKMTLPPTKQPFSQGKRAFTLVELLVVIAIIAVLAVLVPGGTSQMSAKAANEQCISNLRQVGLAVLQYCNENNDAVPGPIYNGINPTYDPTSKSLARYIGRYLDGRDSVVAPDHVKVLECPAHVKAYKPFVVGSVPSYEVHRFGSVPWGGWAGSSTPATPGRRMSLTSINDPNGNPLTFSRAPMIRDYPGTACKSTAHVKYMNAVFWDGHVGPVEPVSPYLPK